jgi:hypothetical protein
MCLSQPKPPKIDPPAPPPPAPPAPPPPKPLPEPRDVEFESEKTKPNVKYGRKKVDPTRARAGGASDLLRIPLNTPTGSGGLNA